MKHFDDNTLRAAAVIFGIKHRPETFQPIPKETIDKKVAEICTPEVMKKIEFDLNKVVSDLKGKRRKQND